MKTFGWRSWSLACLGLLLWAALPIQADVTLNWRQQENEVDATIQDCNLDTLLDRLSASTGWEIYVEPGASKTISTKFKNLNTDEALRRILGKLNYAKFQTNGVTRLLVFQSQAEAATQLVSKPKQETASGNKYLIPNELIIRLRKDAKISIEDLARALGAKISGRDDKARLYRLQFADEKAANAARELLSRNDEVATVAPNFKVEPPAPNELVNASGSDRPMLNPKKPSTEGALIGLIDTGVQPQDWFKDCLLPEINVAGEPAAKSDIPSHGTGMAETMIAAMGDSVSKVLPVNVYRRGETTSTFEVMKGIIEAVNAGANPINLSLGGTGDSELLHQLIREGHSKGIVFVGAAGNEPGTAPTFPAAYPEVVSVTAVNQNGQLEPYANSGSFVDMAANGTSQIVYDGKMWVIRGTSVSTAAVSGLIASEYNKGGQRRSMQEVVAQILKTSRTSSGWQNSGAKSNNR